MKRPPLHSGSALLVVLWALAILTAAVFGWAKWIQQDLLVRGFQGQVLNARALAHSGVAVALHPKTTKQTPQLTASFGEGLNYQARLESEGGKLNINWLLLSGDPNRLAIFKMWLEQNGFNFQERERFADCVADYLDPDNLRRLNGAEDEANYHAANRPLQSVQELLQVRGAEPLLRARGWQDQLTVQSTGPLDLLSAPPDLLRFIPGMSDARIARLLQLRQGPDRMEGTADDPIYQNLPQLLKQLGYAPQEQQAVAQFCMVNDPVVRIFSHGHAGKVHRQVEVVARKERSIP